MTPRELAAALQPQPGDDDPCPCPCGQTKGTWRKAALPLPEAVLNQIIESDQRRTGTGGVQ